MLEEKRIIAVIPARGGSKGVPRKNLRKVNGKSLLALTIETAKASKFLDRIIVSSEDEEIISEAKNVGADVPFRRPQSLAQDDTPSSEPVLHALQQLPGYDFVVVLQVTSPLRTANDIDNAIQFCIAKQAPACVSVSETEANPYWSFNIMSDHKLNPILQGKMPHQRQELPLVYVLNGCIYFANVNWFLTHKSFISPETIGYIMPQDRSLDIDTELDFLYLETYLKNTDRNLSDRNDS